MRLEQAPDDCRGDPRVSLRTCRRERGQVVVLFALLIPMIFGLGAIVLDVGNWYVHKKHLQTQVDAAALAGGAEFVGLLSRSADCEPGRPRRSTAVRRRHRARPTNRHDKPAGPATERRSSGAQRHRSTGRKVIRHRRIRLTRVQRRIPTDLTGRSTGTPTTAWATVVAAVRREVPGREGNRRRAPPLWGLIPLSPEPEDACDGRDFQNSPRSGMLPLAVPGGSIRRRSPPYSSIRTQPRTRCAHRGCLLRGLRTQASPHLSQRRERRSLERQRAP